MSPTVPTAVNADNKRTNLLKPGAERRSELVCRVKYCNTLPDIPFDPKFITYPFESTRFIQYNPTSLERNYKYEVLTEHDLGVTIDLINKDMYAADHNAVLDPADEKLLEEDVLTPHDSNRSRHHSRSVSWLRRTEYISTEQTRFQPQTMDKVEAKVGYSIKKSLANETVFLDRESQIKAIEKTFEDAKIPIEKHYSKPNVVPVEVLPIFPDFKMWKYPCAQVMFDSDPAPVGMSVPAQLEEMSQAMIRGVMDESGEQFVAYFLPTENTLEKRRKDFTNCVDYEDEEEYEYKIAREYNWNVKTKASKGYEENYFLVFRQEGVYFNELETRVRLSKRRQKAGQPPNNTRLVVKHRPMDANEFNIHRQREKQLEPHVEEDEDESEEEDEEEEEPKRAENKDKDKGKSDKDSKSGSDSEKDKSDASDKEGSDNEGSEKRGSDNDDSDKGGSDAEDSDKGSKSDKDGSRHDGSGSEKEASGKEDSDNEVRSEKRGKASDSEKADSDKEGSDSDHEGSGSEKGGRKSSDGEASGAERNNRSGSEAGSDSDKHPDSCVKVIGDMLRAKTVDTTKPAPRPIDATFTPDRLRKEVPRQTPEINESSSDDEKESDLSMDEKLLDDTSKAKSPSTLLCRRCISDDDDEEEAPKTADPREKPRPSKKYFCIFCKKLQTHLSRHLTNMHSDKEEVREFSKRAPGTEIRLKLINKIRGQGAIEYNSMTTEAVREESGSSVQIGRRPKGTLSDVEHYLPCLECGNYYKKRNMRDHYKKCAGKAGPINLLTKCRVRKLGGMIPPSYKVTMSEELKEVLGGMGATPIIMKLVERDPAIVAFGNKLCKTNKHILSTQVHFIRRHLKVMAVITTRMYDRDENDPDRQLSVAYYYRHEKFDLFKSAVTDYMVYEDGTYKSPSQASAIGRIWLNCAKCLSDLYLDLGMKDDRTNLEEWLQKYKSQYYVELEKPATAHQTRSQWGKKMTIPNDEEVAALCSHLRTVMRRHKKQLKIAFDYTHWAQLSKALLVYTTVSNYKRAAEVQGARLSQYRARETYENFASNWSERLTPEDIEQCKLHTRFLVKGKRSKGVSVLMRTEEVESMELLLAHRQNAEVSEDNDFLFAKAHTHFNCQSALREFAKACKVERHHLLTTTKLRKHFASSVTVLNLPGNEMTSVAQFLGHDEKTEARYYRMPDAIEEMARLSTLLYASTTMAIPKLRDRTLRTINQEESALDTAAANASSQNECPAEPISKGASEYLRRLCAINSSHSDEDEDDEEEVVPTTRTGADVNELGKGENRLERSIDPFQEPQPSTSSTYVSPTGVVRDYFPVATYYSSSDDDQNFITRRKTKPKCLFFTPSPEQRHQAVSPPSTRVSRLTLSPETTSSTYVPSENDGSDSATTTSAIANKTTNTPQKRNVQKRLPWTPRQTKVIEDNFKSYLDQKKAPSTKLIEKVISKNKRILKSRTIANIRTHIHNMNTGKTNRSKKVRRLDL